MLFPSENSYTNDDPPLPVLPVQPLAQASDHSSSKISSWFSSLKSYFSFLHPILSRVGLYPTPCEQKLSTVEETPLTTTSTSTSTSSSLSPSLPPPTKKIIYSVEELKRLNPYPTSLPKTVPPLQKEKILLKGNGFQHILDGHFQNGKSYNPQKSYFDASLSPKELKRMIEKGQFITPYWEAGRKKRTFRLPWPIGVTGFDQKPTDCLTVITTADNHLVTAFPDYPHAQNCSTLKNF